MKKNICIIMVVGLVLLFSLNVHADTFSSGSTGADGTFNPPSQVPAGTIIDGNVVTVPLPANGIFNFTTFDVPAGITVKFKRNVTNKPVYILSTGDVNIAGTIDVSGEDGVDGNTGVIGSHPGGKGGPGGFDGGYGGEPANGGLPGKSPGLGLGPGGGSPFDKNGGGAYHASGGSYSTAPYISPPRNATCGPFGVVKPIYGDAVLVNLIGGSGGGGGFSGGSYAAYGGSGGGGGGALLMASSSIITLNGIILSNGGLGGNNTVDANGGGGGSGGAIKLMANSIAGSGRIQATGGRGGYGLICSYYYNYGRDGFNGDTGRIRLEGSTITLNNSNINPAPSTSAPGLVFIPQMPTLTITTIAGSPVPPTAAGSYTAPDITLPTTTTSPISVEIAASNIPVGTTVKISSVPQSGASTSATATLTGTLASSTATASLDVLLTESSVITAEITFDFQMAMLYEGEKIEKVRIASTTGKKSEVTYITKSGKEIKSEKLFASLK